MSERSSSQSKIDANRRNAKKSTGPKTEQGKANSRRNSLTHGLTAQSCLLIGEDPQDLLDLLARLQAFYQPVGFAEEYLVERLAKNQFRTNRCAPMEAAIVNLRMSIDTTPDELRSEQGTWGDRSWGYMRDANGGDAFTKLARYEIAMYREYDRTVKELERLQKNRRAAEAPAPGKPATPRSGRQTKPPTPIDSIEASPAATPKAASDRPARVPANAK